jgi:diguanylate cyclase (GGDEF)-like protein
VTQEFDAMRRAFEQEDRMREAEYGAPDAMPLTVVADWEHLLNAVKTRLRQAVETLPAMGAAAGLNGHAAGLHATVLQSVTALDQLHALLAHDFGRRHCLSAFDDRFARERSTLAQPQRPTLALLYVDLAQIDAIREAHGSEVVDEVLAVTALRLADATRVQDMVRHLGGGAFACLLDDVSDREQLGRLAVQLAAALSAPLSVGDLDLSVRPTIGMATSPTDGDSAAALLRCADAAVARARRQQSGYAFFDAHVDG